MIRFSSCRKAFAHNVRASALLFRGTTGLAALLLASCSWVPRSSPTQKQVHQYTKSSANTTALHYRLFPVTPEIADILASQVRPLISTLDKSNLRVSLNDHIGAGDILGITIFELGNGLFSSSDRSVSGTSSNGESVIGAAPRISSQNLPPTQVEGDGTIMVPYVGRMNVLGKTPSQVAMIIQSHLKDKSQDPQVMVRIQNDIGNTVIVSGEILRPGRVVLSLANEHLSDVIAIAGGAKYPPKDSQVELVRQGKIGATDLATLEDHPEEDIRADPGDRIRVIYQPRTFTAFGAVGQTQQRNEVQFGTANLSLAGAIARIGGPADNRADGNAVYLIRYEDAEICRRLGVPIKEGEHSAPVIYEIDMLNPTQYFLAQKIPMKDHDAILIADAATDAIYKIDMLIGTFMGQAATIGLYGVR
ncbi:polysaccharide export protein [Parasaccharibacter sp. TMW 2.1888]|uniref:polysaccharide biosynthesis/export family protein n=1 Tax=Acetobacteraceae TaxID=433 RepID=UPI001316D97B|nr:polysaccharide biosynthesis/export family protein [Parasaccharibacter sp. TMW 2.1884]MCL1513328.1 polysaccharide export protein [Parasaccharibacter sp. TMW 2.1891]MUG79379.1 polysaccharide export protein [Bombella sp. ESL0380]QGT75046.1 polysaccharide export protein [Bombella sp. ESL0368]UPO80364.1 polysaccharide export protein [Parasaccharibacter sp. TMW 2.1888]MCL1511275.1 polysaccharide export protein [Parasaccharibacter sp. TMW 2.1884]